MSILLDLGRTKIKIVTIETKEWLEKDNLNPDSWGV